MNRLLIVNPYGIGDVLCTVPLLNAVRAAWPSATLGFVCNRRTESLVRAFPGLDTVIVFEKDEFRQQWRRSTLRWLTEVRRLAGTLKAGRWEAAIDLSLNWQFGAALAAVGIPQRYGFDYRGRGRFLTHRRPLTGFEQRPVADYYLDMLSWFEIPRPSRPAIAVPIPDSAVREADAWLAARGITAARPAVALVPGGGASWGDNARYKQWPAQHFAALADRLHDTAAGPVILLGDASDRAVCDAVTRAARAPVRAAGPAPSLLVLAGALRRCRLVIGNDSGALHLAAAVGTPSVAIFGPASPTVYGPYPLDPDGPHRIAVKSLACRPCYARFRLPPCPWGIRCLTTLTPDDVYQTAHPLLAA